MKTLHSIPPERRALPPYWERAFAEYIRTWPECRLRFNLAAERVWYNFEGANRWEEFPLRNGNARAWAEQGESEGYPNHPLDWSRIEIIG